MTHYVDQWIMGSGHRPIGLIKLESSAGIRTRIRIRRCIVHLNLAEFWAGTVDISSA